MIIRPLKENYSMHRPTRSESTHFLKPLILFPIPFSFQLIFMTLLSTRDGVVFQRYVGFMYIVIYIFSLSLMFFFTMCPIYFSMCSVNVATNSEGVSRHQDEYKLQWNMAGVTNHLFSQKYRLFLSNWIRASFKNFEKCQVYCNGFSYRHAFFCAKCDNIKKITGSCYYTSTKLDTSHFLVRLLVYTVSLIALLWLSSPSRNIIFHIKQGKFLKIPLPYLYFPESY